MMTGRDVWMKAGAILAEHGAMTADYIIDQVTDALGNRSLLKIGTGSLRLSMRSPARLGNK